MDNPYDWLQSFIEQVPAILRPVIVALAGAVPYVEGEGAAALGIIAGINPVVAAIAGATGNVACVIGVVVLGAGVRRRVVERRAGRTSSRRLAGSAQAVSGGGSSEGTPAGGAGREPRDVGLLEQGESGTASGGTRRAKGHARLRRWLVRFGVPGASLLGPIALPTMLTAAFLVGSGIPRRRVIFWQVVAIVLWTSAVALAATGVLALLGW